ncbi:hypothetical protein Hanom_Chr07g00601651 [Helianthus anomalus]
MYGFWVFGEKMNSWNLSGLKKVTNYSDMKDFYTPTHFIGKTDLDETDLDSARFDLVSTRLGPAQARRHDIPPSCAAEFDTRSTERYKLCPDDTSP